MQAKGTGFHPSDPDWTRGRAQAISDAEAITRRQAGMQRTVKMKDTPPMTDTSPQALDALMKRLRDDGPLPSLRQIRRERQAAADTIAAFEARVEALELALRQAQAATARVLRFSQQECDWASQKISAVLSGDTPND